MATAPHFGRFVKQLIADRQVSVRGISRAAKISHSSLPYQFAKAECVMSIRTATALLEAIDQLKPLSPAEERAYRSAARLEASAIKDAKVDKQERTEAEALLAAMLTRHGASATARALRGLAVMLDSVSK